MKNDLSPSFGKAITTSLVLAIAVTIAVPAIAAEPTVVKSGEMRKAKNAREARELERKSKEAAERQMARIRKEQQAALAAHAKAQKEAGDAEDKANAVPKAYDLKQYGVHFYTPTGWLGGGPSCHGMVHAQGVNVTRAQAIRQTPPPKIFVVQGNAPAPKDEPKRPLMFSLSTFALVINAMPQGKGSLDDAVIVAQTAIAALGTDAKFGPTTATTVGGEPAVAFVSTYNETTPREPGPRHGRHVVVVRDGQAYDFRLDAYAEGYERGDADAFAKVLATVQWYDKEGNLLPLPASAAAPTTKPVASAASSISK